MGQKVKKIKEAQNEIREDVAGSGLGLTFLQQEDRAQEVCLDLDRETDSLLDSSEVIGREDDVSIVTDRLASLTKQHVLSVVPIVGMAGLGKTTVAKKVCEVVRERKHFDVILWVCVSNDFNKSRILGDMLQQIDRSTGGLTNLDAIIEKLQEKLENKTFFLVLDDVCNEDHGKWDGLKEQLLTISSKKGNVVVVTTRITEIATMMETSCGSQHKPRGLSDEECWSIIKQKVSGGGGATLAADLESIGKDIAKKCGGLPMLAKVLGGTLRRRKETQEWRSILHSPRQMTGYARLGSQQETIKDDMEDDRSRESARDSGGTMEMESGTNTHSNPSLGNAESSCKSKTAEWALLVTSVVLEATSAIFEQLGYPLTSMVMAFVALLLSILDLILKGRQRGITCDGRGLLPCFYRHDVRNHKPFASLVQYFGLAGALWQCCFTTVGYHYTHHKLVNPIKLCLLPFILAFCLLISKVVKSSQHER